jgi:hypothetical protein
MFIFSEYNLQLCLDGNFTNIKFYLPVFGKIGSTLCAYLFPVYGKKQESGETLPLRLDAGMTRPMGLPSAYAWSFLSEHK